MEMEENRGFCLFFWFKMGTNSRSDGVFVLSACFVYAPGAAPGRFSGAMDTTVPDPDITGTEARARACVRKYRRNECKLGRRDVPSERAHPKRVNVIHFLLRRRDNPFRTLLRAHPHPPPTAVRDGVRTLSQCSATTVSNPHNSLTPLTRKTHISGLLFHVPGFVHSHLRYAYGKQKQT